VAYRLELPPNSAVHPVIHVSQLMLAAGFKGQVISHLPSDALQYRVPVQVLDKREVARGESRLTQVLVHWSESPEDFEALKQTFSRAPAWGQAARSQRLNGLCDAAHGPRRGMYALPAQNGFSAMLREFK
jgi:hypothetical protein